MSNSTKTIPILDSLRPYFKALITSGQFTDPVQNNYSSRILANESPVTLIINKCHGTKYTDKDISPEFLLALIKFANEVKKIDNKLTHNSPIGLMTKLPKQIITSNVFGFGNFIDGGIIYTALQMVMRKIQSNSIIKFTDYKQTHQDMFDGSVNVSDIQSDLITSNDLKLSDNWVNTNIIEEIKKIVNSTDVLKNSECSDFVRQINVLKWSNLSPPLGADIDEEKIADIYQHPNDTNSILALLFQNVFIILDKWVKSTGRKCFDIPHFKYSNNTDVKNLIDFIHNSTISKEDEKIFFTIFEIIGNPNSGSSGRITTVIQAGFIHSKEDLNLYLSTGGDINSLRVNLNNSKINSNNSIGNPIIIPVIENWLPDLLSGGKIYVNATKEESDLGHLVSDIFYMIIGANNLMASDEEDELLTYRTCINDLQVYGQTNNIDPSTVLQKCLTTSTGQKAILGTVQGATVTFPRATGVPPPPPPPGAPRQTSVPPSSGPIGAVRNFLQSQSKPGSVVERYLEVFRFDRNNENEIRQLAAYKNGWIWNSSTGKYSKNLGSSTLEFDPMSADDSTITNFIANQCVSLGKTTDCNTILETVLSDNVNARTLNDLLTKSNFSASTSKLESIHPKLAKKVLKNFGFKEVQFTTSFGNKINMIEPVDNWITRFVCTKSELKESCNLLRSAQGKDLRLFLKLLVKAVNEDKKYNTSMSGTSSRVIDTAAEQAELERLNREYGLPIYKYTGVSAKPSSLSLEEIKKGYGSKMDSIYGLRFDGGLNLIGSPLDFNTASMLPFLMLSAQGLGRVPGFRINLNKPLNLMYTSGMVGGASVADIFTNEQLDISTGFDLKSNELKKTWDSILTKLSGQLEASYKTKIEQTIDELIQKEASLLNNLARIQKLKQILDIDPSLVSSGSSSGAFTAEDVKNVADTFNAKMDDYRKTFNRASNILDRLNGQTLMGVFKYTDIE